MFIITLEISPGERRRAGEDGLRGHGQGRRTTIMIIMIMIMILIAYIYVVRLHSLLLCCVVCYYLVVI